jgi:iron(III) transport system permease protein
MAVIAVRGRHQVRVRGPRISLITGLCLGLTVLVGLLTVTPLVAVVMTAFRDAPPGQVGMWSLHGFANVLSQPTYWNVIWTSVWLAVVRAALAVGLAVALAWILARTDCPYRAQLEMLVAMSFFLPGLGRVLSWALLASPNTGYLNQLLRSLPFVQVTTGPLDVYSYAGVIWVSVLNWATMVTIFLLPAFRNLDAVLEEAARVSGVSPRGVLLRITLPLIRPALVAGFILALVRIFSSFEVEVFLGSKAGVYVFTNKIFDLMDTLPADYGTAFALALALLLVTFSMVGVNWLLVGRRNYTTVTGKSYSARTMRLGAWRWLAFAFVALYVFINLVLPALVLLHTSFIKTAGLNVLSAASYSMRNWESVLSLELPRLALWNTIFMSVVATTIGMILCSLVAYVVTRTNFRGRRTLDLLAWIPWGVPVLVLGMGVLWVVLFSPFNFLYGTLAVVIVAQVIRGLPVGTRIMASTMVQIGRELEESARAHGATWLTMFTRIMLPLVKNGFVAGWVMAFSVTFTDLALVAFLTGPESALLPTLFFSLWRNGQLERASAAALIMTVFVLAGVLIVRRITRTGLRNEIV